MQDVLDKLVALWEKEAGFSYRPLVLCVEYPQVYKIPGCNPRILLALAQFCGMLRVKLGGKNSSLPSAV